MAVACSEVMGWNKRVHAPQWTNFVSILEHMDIWDPACNVLSPKGNQIQIMLSLEHHIAQEGRRHLKIMFAIIF